MKSVPDVSQAVARNWGSTRTWASSSYSLVLAAAMFAGGALGLVDAVNHAFLQATYTSSIWATLLSLIGVAFVLRCFRSDR